MSAHLSFSLSPKAGPALRVTGVTKAHAMRAIKWLRDRSLLAWYDPEEYALKAFEFKQGARWTDDVMREAMAETRNGANYLTVRR